jgi:23S rRNA pseudouridine1911/1915/1917 synthase
MAICPFCPYNRDRFGDGIHAMKIEILYQNQDIMILNKPTGVSVTKDRTGSPQLLDLLSVQIGADGIKGLRLVHRLDKDTSGLLLLAKNKQAQTALCTMFENRLIRKTYLAVVRGATTRTAGTVDLPLTGDPKQPNRMSIAAKKGRRAVTEWQLLADFGTAKLLAVHPVTGRTHQIRVHLSAVGLPLVIDPLYASSRPLYLSEFKADYRLGKNQDERPLIERLTLHAYQLVIPTNVIASAAKQSYCFIAPLDKKFAATLKMLTKHNPNGPNAWLNHDWFSTILTARQLI